MLTAGNCPPSFSSRRRISPNRMMAPGRTSATTFTTSNNGGSGDAQAADDDVQHIWMITGPAGCGKTTVARYLAQELNQPYIEGDDVSACNSRFPLSFFRSLLSPQPSFRFLFVFELLSMSGIRIRLCTSKRSCHRISTAAGMRSTPSIHLQNGNRIPTQRVLLLPAPHVPAVQTLSNFMQATEFIFTSLSLCPIVFLGLIGRPQTSYLLVSEHTMTLL